MTRPRRRSPRAFSFVEIVITIAVTSIIGLSIFSAIVYNVKARALAREHTQAARILSRMVEETRFVRFSDLRRREEILVLDDNGTPAIAGDDLEANATLRFYDQQSLNEVSEIVLQDFVVVEATLSWRSGTGRDQVATMVAHFSRAEDRI